MTDPDQLPAQTPLPELLRSVPVHARYCEETPTSAHFFPVGRYCHEAAHSIATERARADALRAELGESDAVRERLAELLKQTAVALRGEPPPLTSWSWHDVPERAAAAIAAIDVMQRAASINAERADALEAALSDVLEMAQEHADHFAAAFAGYKPERHAYYARALATARALLEKKT